ncbi:MAG TPA: N-acetylmuramoyl-L-alanine amidase, partial [Candidatus Hydrogenedens sp.]|nr:N-acetylmuramoyl-L-alanine amidase [Candidatus Hydrogenedens sp.]
IKIPVYMLSDTYLPEGKEERRVADEVKRETELMARMKGTKISRGGLKGIVIIIDPGHGGKDHGAPRYAEKIFEDELNYDIACRLKEYIEQKTQAKVYMTIKDNSQGFKPTSQKIFQHDTDEWILTTPPNNPQDFATSANLRWLLTNSIMRNEEKAGISREKMIFVSIHCDVLYKSSMRGLMIYIPGANYRNGIEKLPQKNRETDYSIYKEWKEHHPKTLTKSQLIKEEVHSKTFARILINTARKNNIIIHSDGPAIRNVIRRSKNSVYVPSVLRNVEIPTKVLVECANLNNPNDLKNVANPAWRQKMAEIIAEAISNYFAM